METFYNIMLYGGLALAVIFAIIAVVLFFVLKIPKAMGDVTGRTAKKKIEEIREKGYESVQGAGASKREAIKDHTSRISVRDIQSSASSRQAEKGRANYEKAVAEINKKKSEPRDEYEEATDLLLDDGDSESATDVLMDYEEDTDILSLGEEEATDILSADDEGATDILSADDEEATDILSVDDDEEATNVLTSDDSEEATDVLRGADDEVHQDVGRESTVKMIMNVIVVHSDESI